jgi:hypothetical protein
MAAKPSAAPEAKPPALAPVYKPFSCARHLFRKFLRPRIYTYLHRKLRQQGAGPQRQPDFLINPHKELLMDVVFIGAIALLLALSWGMARACAQLGERK